MSCLTRKLQHHLAQYLSQHQQEYANKSCNWVKQDLVNRGICPSYVTLDQLELLLTQPNLLNQTRKGFFRFFA